MEETISEQTKMEIKKSKKRTKGKKRVLYLLIIVVLLIILWASYGIYWPPAISEPPSQIIIIEKGQGLGEIAENLKEAGVIQSEFLFKVYTVLKGKQNQLKAGIYDIWSDKNIPAILASLRDANQNKKSLRY